MDIKNSIVYKFRAASVGQTIELGRAFSFTVHAILSERMRINPTDDFMAIGLDGHSEAGKSKLSSAIVEGLVMQEKPNVGFSDSEVMRPDDGDEELTQLEKLVWLNVFIPGAKRQHRITDALIDGPYTHEKDDDLGLKPLPERIYPGVDFVEQAYCVSDEILSGKLEIVKADDDSRIIFVQLPAEAEKLKAVQNFLRQMDHLRIER